MRYVRICVAFPHEMHFFASKSALNVLRYVLFLAAIRAFFGGVTLHCDQNNTSCERDDPLLRAKQETPGTAPWCHDTSLRACCGSFLGSEAAILVTETDRFAPCGGLGAEYLTYLRPLGVRVPMKWHP